jgi:predicted acylesterase/phospholipase RssA
VSPAEKQKRVDLVLEGGGVKGIGLIGALAVLEERGYVPQNVAGTSAGAIAAALIAAGYSAGALATWWMPSSPTSPATATASR